MDLNFAEVLAVLGPEAAFRLANEVTPPGSYLFATLLPERRMSTYSVSSGYMTVRSTMSGLVGMDSTYPPAGLAQISAFLENTAKMALQVELSEVALREIQNAWMQLRLANGGTVDMLINEALNFYNKVILQGMLDRDEWLRGQALVHGEIDWTFNGKNLLVNYGIPVANFIANRTGTSAYDSSASTFWADIREAYRLLRWNVRAIIMHPTTLDAILYNDANNLEILSQNQNSFRIRRLRSIGGNTVQSTDARDTVELITYDLEGEIMNPADTGTPVRAPFMSVGKILVVGNNTRTAYRVGEGSTLNPANDLALGYTHIAPTVEGRGRPGRWGDIYIPQERPWSLVGRCVENSLPVVENPDKIVVLSTDLS